MPFATEFSRNQGIHSDHQQQALTATRVAICGLGGMGGVCAEVLARCGIGHFTLVDYDRFERSNFNRQIHSGYSTEGQYKAEVLGAALKDINSRAEIQILTESVSEQNVDQILQGAHYVVNGMDQMRASVILERHARKLGITIVDAWLTPYASVFVMTPDSPHWEEYLNLPTRFLPVESLSDQVCAKALRCEVDHTLAFGNPHQYIEDGLVEEVMQGNRPRPSLAPVVWLSGTLMANEIVKMVTGYTTADHRGIMYDQYEHRLLTRTVRSPGNNTLRSKGVSYDSDSSD